MRSSVRIGFVALLVLGFTTNVDAQAPTSTAEIETVASEHSEQTISDAANDANWETRRASYPGFLRPGAQLDESVNNFVWAGSLGFLLGYFLSPILVRVGEEVVRPYAWIPIAGPWLVLAGSHGGAGMLPELSGGQQAGLVACGILQAAGLIVFIWSLATPNQSIVYDARVGEPSPFEVSWQLGAPGADLGISLSGRFAQTRAHGGAL